MFLEKKVKKIEKLKDFEERNKKLRTLIEINTYITNSLEKEEVLNRILNQIKVLLKCELSSILLVDKEMNQLSFAFLSKNEDEEILKDTNLKMGEGIAGTVWQNGIPVIINNAQDDPRFSDRADKKSHMHTDSMIAVPLTVNGEIIGVIEAINKKLGDFSGFDLQMLQYISTQSAIAINNADLYNTAIRDGMTKLYINKYFRERLLGEWNRTIRKNHCRYGGEEFTVVLPETNKEEAMTFIERIRALIEAIRLEHEGSTIKLTISGGLATIPDLSPRDHIEMIEMADMALYYSKENGRNIVSFYDAEKMNKKNL